MKRIVGLLVALLCIGVGLLEAKDVHVRGHYRKDGTYVAPHVRTAPNRTRNDNYSTRGNDNPYTGKAGTKPRDEHLRAADRSLAPRVSAESGTASRSTPATPAAAGWPGLRSGMPAAEVVGALGQAQKIERNAGHEVWIFPGGVVYVMDGKVVGWRESKAP